MWPLLPHMVGSSTVAWCTFITGAPQGPILWPLKFWKEHGRLLPCLLALVTPWTEAQMLIRMDTLVRFQQSVLFYKLTSFAINRLQSHKFKVTSSLLLLYCHSFLFSHTLSSYRPDCWGVWCWQSCSVQVQNAYASLWTHTCVWLTFMIRAG